MKYVFKPFLKAIWLYLAYLPQAYYDYSKLFYEFYDYSMLLTVTSLERPGCISSLNVAS